MKLRRKRMTTKKKSLFYCWVKANNRAMESVEKLILLFGMKKELKQNIYQTCDRYF